MPTMIPPRETRGPLSRAAPRRPIRRFRARRSVAAGLALSIAALFGVVGGADVLFYNARLPSVRTFLRLPYVSSSPDRPPKVAVSGSVPMPAIVWRDSKALGLPYSGGGLVRGVELPAEGPAWISFDSALRRSPSRSWRRNGTATLIHGLLKVTDAYHRHTGHRLVIGDLSRTNGGSFSAAYGGQGHASHQNGLDVDIYWPRSDSKEIPPATVSQIDVGEAQFLVDQVLKLMHPQLLVTGSGVPVHMSGVSVQIDSAHNDQLHVRIPNPG